MLDKFFIIASYIYMKNTYMIFDNELEKYIKSPNS